MSTFSPSMSEACIVGIDVSEAKLDVRSTSVNKHQTFNNNASGIAKIVSHLQRIKASLVVMESTGSYHRALAKALYEVGISVHVSNPRCVRHFALAAGLLAKNDAIDARTLMEFGIRMCPKPTPPPDPAVEALSDLRTRHQQLTEMLTSEKNRFKTCPPDFKDDVRDHIAYLNKKIRDLERKLAQHIEDNPKFKKIAQIIRSVPGVGPGTTAALISGLPELGDPDPKKIIALVGVAPYARDSGKYKGQRRIWGGRSHVRCALYMAVLTAIRLTDQFKEYYKRLVQAGKLKKVALTACIRKLVVVLNAMVRSKKTWCPDLTGA